MPNYNDYEQTHVRRSFCTLGLHIDNFEKHIKINGKKLVRGAFYLKNKHNQ